MFFCWLQPWNHWKRFKMNEIGRKTAQKNVATSFWVRAAPKSWSKYTTTKGAFINDITQILRIHDPPPSSVTLKLLFYLQLYSDCHKRVKPPSPLIAWRHLWMLPKVFISLTLQQTACKVHWSKYTTLTLSLSLSLSLSLLNCLFWLVKSISLVFRSQKKGTMVS